MEAAFTALSSESIIQPTDRFVPGYRETPTIRMKLSAFREYGLGCGLGDVGEALIETDGKKKLFRLIGTTYDPADPAVITTRWMLREA